MHPSSEPNEQDDNMLVPTSAEAAPDGSVHTSSPSNEPNNQDEPSSVDNQNPNRQSDTDQPRLNAEGGETINTAQNGAMLTVAVLLAAATYQAVYNPPGGLWQEDGTAVTAHHLTSTTAEMKKVAGVSILATKHKHIFILFVLGNTLGFLFSMATIEDLISDLTHKLELYLAIGAISVTYGICVFAISPSQYQIYMTLTVVAAIVFVILVRVRSKFQTSASRP